MFSCPPWVSLVSPILISECAISRWKFLFSLGSREFIVLLTRVFIGCSDYLGFGFYEFWSKSCDRKTNDCWDSASVKSLLFKPSVLQTCGNWNHFPFSSNNCKCSSSFDISNLLIIPTNFFYPRFYQNWGIVLYRITTELVASLSRLLLR